MSHFHCSSCASPAIAVPSPIENHSLIRCRRCGMSLGTWGELKERAQRGAMSRGHRVSCDPLEPLDGAAAAR